jgi:hypothetical protein
MQERETGRSQNIWLPKDPGFDLDVHLPKMDVNPVHAGRHSGYRFVQLNLQTATPERKTSDSN